MLRRSPPTHERAVCIIPGLFDSICGHHGLATLSHHINPCKDRGIGGRVELSGLKNTNNLRQLKGSSHLPETFTCFKNGAIQGNVLRFGQGSLEGGCISLFSYSSDKISNVSAFGEESFISVHSLGEQSITVGERTVLGCGTAENIAISPYSGLYFIWFLAIDPRFS